MIAISKCIREQFIREMISFFSKGTERIRILNQRYLQLGYVKIAFAFFDVQRTKYFYSASEICKKRTYTLANFRITLEKMRTVE